MFCHFRDGARAKSKPLVFDKKSGELAAASRVDIAPALVGEFTLADGRKSRPVFRLIALVMTTIPLLKELKSQ